MSADEIYDISKYSEKQLYDLLDISNPTDRELEARILHLIRKYANIQNDDGNRLLKFFEDIYDHFFQEDDDENDENTKEGFTDQSSTPQATASATPTPQSTAPAKTSQIINDQKTDSKLVTQADYIPDTLRLNPLLKQTIKRIICIDSQYRDVKVYPNTNRFSFDLSEPLRDVVSLKLYSIQIPYTWYTISKSYGSNFFYLKGITDGINNGYHDYKIVIPAGNYDSNSIVEAVNKGFAQVFSENPDTSFNNTGINYDKVNSISTTTINIQKTYTESYFTLEFPNWTESTYITDANGDTAAIPDVSRNTSIPCYLGLNYNNYSLSTIFSSRNLYSTNYINNDNKKNFQFDNSNNYFTVIQYIGPSIYNPSSSRVINSYTITLYDVINNTKKPVISNDENQYYFTRANIITIVNTAIQNANLFTSDSNISQFDISGVVINANNTCFKLKLMFDRNKVLYQPNSNIAVIFPTENPANYSNTTVWTYQGGIANSCFYFKYSIDECSKITSELPIVQSDFNVNVNNNVYVYYKCWTPYYMAQDSINDISFTIPPANYSLNQFVSQLNTSLQTISNSVTFNSDSKFSLVNSKLNCKMDFYKEFKNSDYIISFDSSSVLCSILNFAPINDLSLSSLTAASGTFEISYSGYLLDSSYVLTINPNPNSKNKNEPERNIYLPVTNYANYTQLINGIQKAIAGYTIQNSANSNIQLPYSQSTIKITNTSATTVTAELKMNVNYSLDETNYIMSFYPSSVDVSNSSNPWFQFGIEPSYNLYLYNSKNIPYSEFSGKNQVTENKINIREGQNDTILINAIYDPSGGAYTSSGSNNIKLTIPEYSYTTNSLTSKINYLLSQNPYTLGSFIHNVVDPTTNLEYIEIILNINRIYTSSDYQLTFFDPFSFVACSSNLKGIQSATWDTTLGWILGYRDYVSYNLTLSNQSINADTGIPYYLQSLNSVYQYSQIYQDPSNILLKNSIIELSADTTLTTSIYNYFVISLDDYNQNHINDGLVTITRSQTSIQMPSYASTSRKICDPVTNTLVNRSIPQSNTDNLTENQIYSINQSVSSQNPTTPIFSAGPYVKDLFGYIPVKPGTNGQYFIEYGGGLQLQERLYFGPVNIRKMSIELMTDRGDLLDLNGSNWSFSFICEQLYRSGNSNNG
jgi:hypothetical protein